MSGDPLQPVVGGDQPFDATADEIESRAEFDTHHAKRSLAGLVLLGLRLDVDPPDFTGVDVRETLFLGCHMASDEVEIDLTRRGAHVVPPFETRPYPTHPAMLYTPEDLAAGFGEKGFAGMYDTVVYQHFLDHGGATPDIREAIAQRLHDAGIDNALGKALSGWAATHDANTPRPVGIMGGHAEPRGSAAYRMAAELSWRLAGSGRLIVTGGGPGVMEAANLGAYFSHRELSELSMAIDAMREAPDFRDHDPFTAAALAVRRAYPAEGGLTNGGLALPTWLYGHEPANLFAGQIGKYFSNAVREDSILRLSRGGIVFAPGWAGTVQEIFQAATKTFYRTDGPSGAFVFLGVDHWAELPVEALLRPLLARSPFGDQSDLIVVTDSLDEAVAALS
ncbi:LOG family protein [Actinoplanes sp. NPDC049265]|uniref:LOG family protein n=1 Tax=Actinoplanes sp. NPDC049265 TaxID=3363902 RepID=UPI00371C6C4D